MRILNPTGRRGVLLAAAAALTLVLTACGSSASGGESTDGSSDPITILYSRAAEQAGLWVAQDEGMFSKHGLTVKLSEVKGASDVAVALSGGSAQMGFETAPDFLSAVDAGVKLVVASGLSVDIADNPRVALIAGKDSGINSLADLAGKSIAVPGVNTSSDLSTIRLLEKAGVDVKGIKWVSMTFQQAPDALKAKRVDAAVSVYPFIGLLKSQGNKALIDHYASGDERQLVVFLSADAGWASKHAKQLSAVRAALDEANAFIKAEPDKARTVIEKYTGLSADIVSKIPMPNLETAVSKDQLDFFVDIMKKQGLIKGELDTASLIAK
jgi:NitT/TauT family transport system substrate-binding protein